MHADNGIQMDTPDRDSSSAVGITALARLASETTGTAGNDSLEGTAGDDTLSGGAGNDTIDGLGGTDTASYAGGMAGYRFGVDASGRVTVTDVDAQSAGNDGVDALSGVERVAFADGVVEIRQYLPTQINATNSNDVDAVIAPLGNAGYAVLWWSSTLGIRLQRFDSDGNRVGDEIEIVSAQLGVIPQATLAMLADGSLAVAWREYTGSLWEIHVQRFDPEGTATGSETRVELAFGQVADMYSITPRPDGSWQLAWRSLMLNFAQEFTLTGESLGPPVPIGALPMPPVTAALADGDFVSVVVQRTFPPGPATGVVFTERYDAQGNTIRLSGDDAANRIVWSGNTGVALAGGAGNDTLTGGNGNDSLDGGAGADSMTGGSGNDIYVVDDAGDLVVEASNRGTDTVRSSAPQHTLAPHAEHLELVGSASIAGTGNDLANALTGNAGNNLLAGAGGNDTLRGGGGADTLAGGAGDDVHHIDSGDDVVVESAGEGRDTVRATVDHVLAPNVENLVLEGAALTGAGNELDNTIAGTAADNTLSGGAGNDTLDGGGGDFDADTADYSYVTSGGLTVTLNSAGTVALTVASGSDVDSLIGIENIVGGAGNDTLTGDDGINTLFGGDGMDLLSGGAGNDVVAGNAGNDTLTGGQGTDRFVFSTSSALGGADVVTDFTPGGETFGSLFFGESIDFAFGATGELAQGDLRGTGLHYAEVAAGGEIGLNVGLVVVTATGALTTEQALTFANGLVRSGGDQDILFVAFSNGTDSAIFRVSDSDDGNVIFDSAQLLVTLQGIGNAASFEVGNFVDFST